MELAEAEGDAWLWRAGEGYAIIAAAWPGYRHKRAQPLQTDKLYSIDSYRRAFEARVVARETTGAGTAVALDRTAFYPTGGGQPNDTGTLNGIPVVDVVERDGLVWHQLDGEMDQDQVLGAIEWGRRWDHMQNHTGQHILSQAFILAVEAETVAWHLSPTSLTIDVARVGMGDGDLERVERLANTVIQENRGVTSRVVAPEKVTGLALRKAPQVAGPLRIVEIADFDRVACGGTHVRGTAEVGVLKILRGERRGQETRIHFVCGNRAVADYTRKHQLVRSLASRFNRGEDELLVAVEQLQQEAQTNHKALRAAQEAQVAWEAERLGEVVAAMPAPRVVGNVYTDWRPEQVKKLALALRGQPGCFIALAGGDPPQVIAARSDDVEADAGQMLRTVLAEVGGRGGGKADFAQGSAPSLEAAARAVESLIQEIKHGGSERWQA